MLYTNPKIDFIFYIDDEKGCKPLCRRKIKNLFIKFYIVVELFFRSQYIVYAKLLLIFIILLPILGFSDSLGIEDFGVLSTP